MPAATPAPLDAAECKLLARYPDRLDPVLKDFNAAVEKAKVLAAKWPKEADTPDAVEAVERLAAARRSLTTPRFKVGFLGPFQCGKSTILNNLLGQEVSGVGVGEACTSIVTRLIVGEPGKPAEMSLTYFTVDGYQTRRNTLCEWAQLKNPAGRGDAQLLELLKTHTTSTKGASSARPVLDKDIPYLEAFIQSHIDFQHNLVRADAPFVEGFPWNEEKKRLLTHAGGKENAFKPSRQLLVAESSITFPTDRVDPELEMVDCPGLASGRSVDDLLTSEYIKELDGALVFLRAGAMDSREVSEILSALKTQFRDTFKSRVWVVVNQLDVPEPHAKLAAPGKKTTFGVIIDMMAKYSIPLSQVCLGCNGIFTQAAKAGGTAPRATALSVLKLYSPEDDANVKAQLADTPELAEAYEELLKDGGVSRLGRLIKEKVRPSVADQILAKTAADAKQSLADLEYVLGRCEKPVSAQERKDTVAWENALLIVLSQLSGGRMENGWPVGRGPLFARLEQLGKEARAQLETKFRASTPDEVLGQMTTTELFDRFDIDADQMQDEVDHEFDRVVQAAYTEVTSLLEARNLPAVTLPGGKDPMAVWVEGRQEDRVSDAAWRERLRPRLRGDGFAGRMRDDSLAYAFNGTKYKTLFEDKLRAAAQQITLAVRGQLRTRLDAVRRQVRRKLGATAGQPAGQPPAPAPVSTP